MKNLFFIFILILSPVLFSQDVQTEESAEKNETEQEEASEPEQEETEEVAQEEETPVAEEPDENIPVINELSALKEEVSSLKGDMKKWQEESFALKKELLLLKEAASAEKKTVIVAEVLTESKEKGEKVVKIKPYGFIEIYGYGNDAKLMSNDLMVYVLDQEGSVFGMSARNTRLGLDISVPYIKSVDLSAKLEIDFVGSLPDTGNAETSTGIRMRHAFFKVAKTFETDTTLALLAGQTWATAIIPTFPNIINPAGGWGAGNLWNRLPLVELELAQKAGHFDFGLKAAAVKPITGTSANRRNFIEVNIDAGEASHWPSLQGQLYLKFKIPSIDVFWAAGGAYGREDYTSGVKVNNGDDLLYGNEVEVWMFNTALKVVHKYAELQGKYFIGKNLDMFGFFGGSIIKKDGIVMRSMSGTGFWADVTMKPVKNLRLSVGLGSEYTSHTQSVYDQNDTFWLSLFYTFFGHFTPGFQWQQIVTEKDDAKLTGNSYIGSLKFSF
jgi:hypothetical protein